SSVIVSSDVSAIAVVSSLLLTAVSVSPLSLLLQPLKSSPVDKMPTVNMLGKRHKVADIAVCEADDLIVMLVPKIMCLVVIMATISRIHCQFSYLACFGLVN